MHFETIEDYNIAFSNICICLGLSDTAVKIRITDPFTLQMIQFHLWRHNTCQCLELLPLILKTWTNAYLEVLPTSQYAAHCCSDLIMIASRKQQKTEQQAMNFLIQSVLFRANLSQTALIRATNRQAGKYVIIGF